MLYYCALLSACIFFEHNSRLAFGTTPDLLSHHPAHHHTKYQRWSFAVGGGPLLLVELL